MFCERVQNIERNLHTKIQIAILRNASAGAIVLCLLLL